MDSLFYPEDGGSNFLRNIARVCQIQKTVISVESERSQNVIVLSSRLYLAVVTSNSRKGIDVFGLQRALGAEWVQIAPALARFLHYTMKPLVRKVTGAVKTRL
jgi:hypothetical protein